MFLIFVYSISDMLICVFGILCGKKYSEYRIPKSNTKFLIEANKLQMFAWKTKARDASKKTNSGKKK